MGLGLPFGLFGPFTLKRRMIGVLLTRFYPSDCKNGVSGGRSGRLYPFITGVQVTKFYGPLLFTRIFLCRLNSANCPATMPIPSWVSFVNQECSRAYLAEIRTSGFSAKSFKAKSLAAGEIVSH